MPSRPWSGRAPSSRSSCDSTARWSIEHDRLVTVPTARAVPDDQRWLAAKMPRVRSSWRTEGRNGPVRSMARRDTCPRAGRIRQGGADRVRNRAWNCTTIAAETLTHCRRATNKVAKTACYVHLQRLCQGRSARAASTSLSIRSMTSCLSKAVARFFTRLIAATEFRIANTAEPTPSAGRLVRPGLSAATPEDLGRAKLSAVASLVRNSAVTSLSEADRDAWWTTQWVGDGCITDAIRANQLP